MKRKKGKLRVLLVAAEAAPLASVGGLSQVMYFLPRSLHKLGVDARIMIPKFASIDERKFGVVMEKKDLRVPTGEIQGMRELICNVKVVKRGKEEPIVYLLENMEYYEKRANVYGYSDDHIRFALLSRGAIEFLRPGEWLPDLIHANDWHASYLANYLRTDYAGNPKLRQIAMVLSIHNLHQGLFDFQHASALDFDDGKGKLASFFSDRLVKQNSLKRGIIYSDIVSTVSERYSREIMTSEYGQGLHELLKEVRTKVFGILNGIDYEEFDPESDNVIKKNYTIKTISYRLQNKIDLQKEFNLPVNPNIPVLATCGRLDMQKGLDLLAEILPFLLDEYQIQFIAMGGGDVELRERFEKIEKQYPRQVATHLLPNFSLPRKIYAGADMFLLPSRYEPGGIVVMEAMRYGCVPIVRATGGCADTVVDVNGNKKGIIGTGFSFEKFEAMSFLATIVRALTYYKIPSLWQNIVKASMSADFSWNQAAQRYIEIYRRAAAYRREQLSEKPHQAYRVNY